MTITIESNGTPLTPDIESQIREKVNHLKHFFENIVDTIVYLHDEPDHKQVEMKVNVRNETLFVKENGENYLAALDVALDVMKRNIKKYKERTLKKN